MIRIKIISGIVSLVFAYYPMEWTLEDQRRYNAELAQAIAALPGDVIHVAVLKNAVMPVGFARHGSIAPKLPKIKQALAICDDPLARYLVMFSQSCGNELNLCVVRTFKEAYAVMGTDSKYLHSHLIQV